MQGRSLHLSRVGFPGRGVLAKLLEQQCGQLIGLLLDKIVSGARNDGKLDRAALQAELA